MRSHLKLVRRGFGGYAGAAELSAMKEELPQMNADAARELAALVTRVEAGERVVESRATPEADEVARRVIELLDLPGTPDFLVDALRSV